MPSIIELTVPDIGDFKDVDVIEVLVNPGDRVRAEDSLLTLESDKATVEVPAPQSGIIREMRIRVGDKVSKGTVIGTLEVEPQTEEPEQGGDAEPGVVAAPQAVAHATAKAVLGEAGPAADIDVDVVVLGSGPGGYTAAFRAADLGMRVALVERYPSLGGVCLNVGCIPSKALLHVAKVIDEAHSAALWGVEFEAPRLNLEALRSWKDGVVARLTRGIAGLAKQRGVRVIRGTGRFSSPHTLRVESPEGVVTVGFQHAIIAAGSRPIGVPGLPEGDPRILDSTGALALADIPHEMLVIGGGIIGLEMATVYAALGCRVTVVELMDKLMTGCDEDLVRPLARRIAKRYENIYLGAKVVRAEPQDDGLRVHFEGKATPQAKMFDRVLVAIGRRPNGDLIGAENAGVRVNDSGFIDVDRQQRTNVEHIYAVGDIVGSPMLAHKATHQGKVAAEVIAGLASSFDARAIPSVAYTDPEVAWVGVTEDQAKIQQLDYGKGVFPWGASGRSLAMGRDDGLTKLLVDQETKRVIGAGIVGPSAGDLIAEAVLAIEMGAEAADMALTIHPHPTLSETVAFAAEAYEGTITDLYLPKKS